MVYYPKEPVVPYIDRPKFHSDVLALIQSGPTEHILGETQAIYGTGKTTALSKIYYELKAAAAPNAPKELKELRVRTPIWLPLDGFSMSQTNEHTQDKDSLTADKQNFDKYKLLLIELGSQIDSKAFKGLDDLLDNITGELLDKAMSINIQAQGGNIQIGAVTKLAQNDIDVGNVSIALNVDNWEVILRDALEKKVVRSTQAFLKIYKSLDQKKKFVVIADDYYLIMDHPIGGWFLDLVKKMDNMVTLVSITITNKNFDWDSHQMVSLTLLSFSQDEVHQYMLQRKLDLSDAQIEKVYNFSKAGHPLLVSLAGDLLARLDRRDSQDVDSVLDRLVGKHIGHHEPIFNPHPIELDDLTDQIDRCIIELRNDIQKYDPLLLYGLNVIALARVFDYNLLKFMFKRNLLDGKDEGFDENKAEEQAERLAHEMMVRMPDYSVIQELEDRDLKNSVYRVQYIVRSRMEANLIISEPPEHIQQIHNQLIDYYQDTETEKMKSGAEYTSMFRMEHADFQKVIVEWLYHLFCLEDRTRARLLLCKFFLEAFDWWGWYIDFDFCDDLCNDLLVQWGTTQPSDDQNVVRFLLKFKNAYPTGYDKHGKGDWGAIVISLNNLLASLKLNLTPDQMNSDQRMVRGHLDRYIAESYRFKTDPDFQRAEASYLSSLNYFDVQWNKAWIVNYLGDLYLDWMNQLEAAGEVSAAQEKAVAAKKYANDANQMAFEAEKSYQDQDHELMSQNCRILGSVYLRQSDCGQAFQAFTRSIAHAYIFHFLDDTQDEYSFQFYQDTGEQVLQALDFLVKQGRLDEAHTACQSLRRFWEQQASLYIKAIFSQSPDDFDLDAALSTGQTDRLRQYILPVLPEVGAEGDPIDTGVAVSQTIVNGI